MNENKRYNERYVAYVTELAKEKARSKGLNIDQIVAHESDPTAYRLKEIKGETAVVEGKADTIKEFPLDELFDPNEASHILVKKRRDEIKRVFEEKSPHLN